MNLSACGIFGSLFAMGAVDALSGPAVVQYGALAILGGTVFYLLKAQRADLKAFLRSQEEARHDFKEALNGTNESLDRMATIISGTRRSDGH